MIFCRDSFFNFFGKAFFNFHDFRTFCANKMMVMAVVIFADEFKARRAIAKIKPFHHSHFFKQVHQAINRRQIAFAFLGFPHFGKNFPVRQRMRMRAQNFQNGRARAGDFSRLTAQTVFERGHFLPPVRMGMFAFCHVSKISPAMAKINAIVSKMLNR
jgi:hypothetical protein